MRELQAQTTGWQFILEPEARWLAVECLLLATRLRLDFNKLYVGALGDEMVSWQRKMGSKLSLVQRAGFQGMTIATDELRIAYLAARHQWVDIHNNELIPLGRALEYMVKGHSKNAAISKAISLYRKRRADIRDINLKGSQKVPPIEAWPSGYRFLSVDSFRQRFKHFECVLPYAYIYYRNRDYNTWAGLIPDERNPVILPEDFEVWNVYFWQKLQETRRIRLRPPSQPVSILFQ